jgi:hypothetical protein
MIPEQFTPTPHDAASPPPECPDCENSEFVVREREQVILYGRKDCAVEVPCLVPKPKIFDTMRSAVISGG